MRDGTGLSPSHSTPGVRPLTPPLPGTVLPSAVFCPQGYKLEVMEVPVLPDDSAPIGMLAGDYYRSAVPSPAAWHRCLRLLGRGSGGAPVLGGLGCHTARGCGPGPAGMSLAGAF